MRVREIQGHLEEMYGIQASPDFISSVTDAVVEEVRQWQSRPLGVLYPLIATSWRRHWEEVIPFFAYPVDVRKIIYTTNAIESLHMQLRKIIKTRGHFPKRRGGHQADLSCL